MLYPDDLKDMPDYFVQNFRELEDWVVQDFGRRVGKAGQITDTAEWQLIRATELNMSADRFAEKLAEVADISIEEARKMINDAADLSMDRDKEIYRLVGEDVPTSEQYKKYINAASRQLSDEFANITGSMGFAYKDAFGNTQFTFFQNYYNQCCDLAQMQVSTGTLSYQQAIKSAVDKMVNSGLRTVDYASGYQCSAEGAVRRSVLTGVNQMADKMNQQVEEDLDAEYVEVSAHAGARPSHAVWQGRVYKLVGSEPGYPNLVDATGYGSVTGLCGANCRHSKYAFFPGISERAYTDYDLEHMDPWKKRTIDGKEYTYYEATQRQRAIERQIRKSKQKITGYEAAGNMDDAIENESIKLQRLKQYYKSFSNKASLRMDNSRHQVTGFDKSISQKAVWTYKKVANSATKKYNKDETKSVDLYLMDKKLAKDIKESYNLTHKTNKYKDHTKEEADKTGRSYLTITYEEAQEIVNKYATTGTFVRKQDESLKWVNKERIEVDHDVGVYRDEAGFEAKTNKLMLVYSKKGGTHLIPRRP